MKLRQACAILMAFLFLACTPAALAEDELLTNAIRLACDLDVLAESETYLKAMGVPDGVRVTIDQYAAGEYSAPTAAWCLRLAETGSATALLASSQQTMQLEGVVGREMMRGLLNGYASMLNAMKGTEVVAASSILTISHAFPMEGLERGCLYLLQYESGLPVMVCFWPEGNGVVSATARFVMMDNLDDVLNVPELRLMLEAPEAIPLTTK